MSDDAGDLAALALSTTRDGAAVLITVAGELDAHSAPALDSLTTGLRADGCTDFTLDLAQTSFVDSSGLRSLVALHTDLVSGGGGTLTLRAPSAPVVRLLSITGLADHFTVA